MMPLTLTKKLLVLVRILFILTNPTTYPRLNKDSDNPLKSLVLIQTEENRHPPYSISHVSLLLTPPSPFQPKNFKIRKAPTLSLCQDNSPGSWSFILLILSGDVETNPGPPSTKYPCGICSKPCKSNQPAIQCNSCEAWIHKKCVKINPIIWESLANTSVSWECLKCGMPNYSSSFFEDTCPSNLATNPYPSLLTKKAP